MLKKLPILTFHSIDCSGSVISFAPSYFDDLIRDLVEKGFETLMLADVVEWLEGKKNLPSRAILLTFDDGYESVLRHAAPILADLGCKATLFVTVDHCGLMNDWPTQPKNIPRMPLLNWSQLREMSRNGFDIQAHTCTHPALPELQRENQEDEILRCKAIIEDKLGTAARYFCYPYGEHDESVRRLVSEHFDAACSTALGFVDRTSDPYQLQRVEMYYFSGPVTWRLFSSPGLAPYLWFRRLLRNLRRQN